MQAQPIASVSQATRNIRIGRHALCNTATRCGRSERALCAGALLARNVNKTGGANMSRQDKKVSFRLMQIAHSETVLAWHILSFLLHRAVSSPLASSVACSLHIRSRMSARACTLRRPGGLPTPLAFARRPR
ncbi:hypothetical protein [Paraburkholderia sp. J67]|uniref:hypothetical protein n=1 Tax=Paraburkholderia sp. J67 TaxID=2805435 RepID=UPI002ABE999B|nr:hypothetical protein [Paraburkholderia sp. J67]